MERRQFIKDTVLGLPILLSMPLLLENCGKDDIKPIKTDKKIVVIGAGIAGLSVANYFKERGIDVILLESRDKVGGRLRVNRTPGFAFDEGASWIHGPNGNPITDLAEKSGTKTFLTSDDSVVVYDIDGSKYAENVLDDYESKYLDDIAKISGNGALDVSFGSVFYNKFPQTANDRLWTYLLSAYLEFDTGGDISKLSSLDYYDDENFKGEDVIVTNGYDTIAEYLAKNIDVRLNQRVTAIDYSGAKTQITTESASFEADFLIVCTPLGILKQQKITFTPNLPAAKMEAIENTQMGAVNKFLLVWDTAFWDTNLQYIGYTPEEKGKFNYFLNMNKFANANALMTFALGDYGAASELLSDDACKAEIMKHLRAIYGQDTPYPKDFYRTKWTQDPDTFGAYSFASNGSRSTDFDTLAEKVDDRLFFAGEHTSREYRSTVHGAYLSGLRAAKEVVDLL